MSSSQAGMLPPSHLPIRPGASEMGSQPPETRSTGSKLQINTYHCICNQLVLASTLTLDTLARRQPPNQDSALILPLPPPPRTSSSSSSSSASSDDDDDEDSEQKASSSRKRKKQDKRDTGSRSTSYSILLSTTLDRRPIIVRREDGFEKRWLWRCGRCRVVLGYQLDEIHFTASTISTSKSATSDMDAADGADDGGATIRGGKMGKVVYLLPMGLLSTDDMARGKRRTDDEVDLREIAAAQSRDVVL